MLNNVFNLSVSLGWKMGLLVNISIAVKSAHYQGRTCNPWSLFFPLD